MKTVTVNLSFPFPLLKQIDRVARHESRNRSDLLREAARAYVERESSWKSLQVLVSKKAESLGIKTEEDVCRAVSSVRKSTGQETR